MDNQTAVVRAALANPIGVAPLAEMLHPTDRVGVVFSDITRATPYDVLVPPILEQLKALPEERIVGKDSACENEIRLVDYDPDAENKVIAALAYPPATGDYEHLLAWVRGLPPEEKEKLLQSAIGSPRSFDAGPRALETTAYTFEITIDYGAWRDIQRHRICTQLIQDFSPELGYVEPAQFAEIGLTEPYRQARDIATGLYRRVRRQFPAEAIYLLPLGYRVRTVFAMNLREAYRFARLRSSPHGHESYRRIAVLLWEQIRRAHPLLARYLPGVHAFSTDKSRN